MERKPIKNTYSQYTIPKSKFQIGLILNSLTSFEVNRKIRELQRLVKPFNSNIFKDFLCDNGIEFDDVQELEVDEETAEVVGHVFYTRPYCSGDKGSCERNHEFFRYVIKKGTSLNNLTQESLNLIFSHINSYPRKSLEYKTPYEVFSELYGEDVINQLDIKKIEFKDLKLKK